MAKRILLVASNPSNTLPLDLKLEFSEIIECIEASPNRDSFEVELIETGAYPDFRRKIRDCNPDIVHFSGHGEKNGLLFVDNNNNALLASSEQIAELFSLLSEITEVECVIINACDSNETARAVNEYVPNVIGMNAPIKDDDAIQFARGLYDGIVESVDYVEAFRWGLNAIFADEQELMRTLTFQERTSDNANNATHIPVFFPKDLLLIEYNKRAYKKFEKLEKELASSLTPMLRRLDIGYELLRLGDRRSGVNVDTKTKLPDIEWIEIPGGEYYFDDHIVVAASFSISRYLITNIQYESFINSAEYQDEAYWKGIDFVKSEVNAWNALNQPKSGVTWYEAIAFTRWLSRHLEEKITLPTEEEWEIAARGPKGLIYPWGNEYLPAHANCNEDLTENNPTVPTFVGMYTPGASHYGVLDMAGNVWEWCLNKFGSHDRQIDASGDERTIKGGSFIRDHDNAKNTFSRGNAPGDTDNFYIGIRLVKHP